MAMKVDFGRRCLVVVTGASRGIGRSIALELSRLLKQDSIVVLLARSNDGLHQTKDLIQEVDKSLTVITEALDLAKADAKTFEGILDKVTLCTDTTGIEFGLVFHNAGSTGQLVQTTDLTSITHWRDYYDLNLFSVTALNSVFIKKLRVVAPQLVVVNISSVCGTKPYENMAMYGSGKAAREMFFKVLAQEEPKIIVLNYSPGPVDTDMFEGVIQGAQSEELRSGFKSMKEKGILTTEQTVTKLLGILEKGDFTSGDTIDYFNRE